MMTWIRRTLAAIVLLSFSFGAFADSPSESGVVTRTDEPFYFVFWYDPDKNWSTYFGIDPLLSCIGNPDGWQSIPVMRVFMDTDGDDILRFMERFRGDLLTSVWEGFVPPGGPFGVCSGVTPIANGYSRFKGWDNDKVPWLNPDRHNANAFGFNANGTLIYYDTGEPARFTMLANAVWDGLDSDSFRVLTRTTLD